MADEENNVTEDLEHVVADYEALPEAFEHYDKVISDRKQRESILVDRVEPKIQEFYEAFKSNLDEEFKEDGASVHGKHDKLKSVAVKSLKEYFKDHPFAQKEIKDFEGMSMEDQYRHLVNFFEEHEIGHQGQNDDVPSLDNIIQQLAGDKEATVKSVKYSIGSVKDQYAQRIAKKTLQDKATSKIKGKHGLALRRYMKDFVKEKGLQVVDPNSFYMRAGSLDHALQMRNELKGQYQDNQKMKQLGLKYEPPKEEKKK